MKTAINNMNADQILVEETKIFRQRQELDREQSQIRARFDRVTIFKRGWQRRMSAISKRLFEIGTSEPAYQGEVAELFALQNRIFERFEMHAAHSRDLYQELTASYKKEDALDRRENLALKRSRELQSQAA